MFAIKGLVSKFFDTTDAVKVNENKSDKKNPELEKGEDLVKRAKEKIAEYQEELKKIEKLKESGSLDPDAQESEAALIECIKLLTEKMNSAEVQAKLGALKTEAQLQNTPK